mmetsp:Transcript_35262/g.76056  ORF Transcript_35262/g.76056 Transcript_35262/m.76056 type:complete len:269 (-) Transcript_35262:320-1126(-)
MSSWFTSGPEIVYPTVPSTPIATGVVEGQATDAGLMPELLTQLNAKVAEFSGFCSSQPEEWEAFFKETKGVKGMKKFVEGQDLAVVRSEAVMPYNIVDVAAFFASSDNIKAIDEMFDGSEVLQKLSAHSWLSVDKVKGVWPAVSPRDLLEMYNWRLLDDGSVLYFHFSVVDESLKPVDATGTFVRAHCIVMGYFLRPAADGAGTDVRMIFSSNPGGQLPSMIVNQTISAHPTAMVNAKAKLDALKEAGKLKDIAAPATYADFAAVFAK